MDSVKNINFKVRNTLFYSVISAKAKEDIGIDTASGVLQNQGWLVWLKGIKGVYDMFLLPGGHDNAASYLLKYYPSPDEELFSKFSEEEQEIRKTFVFENGVPKYGDREDVMAGHFITGQLDILWEDRSVWLHLNVLEDENSSRKSELPVVQISHHFYSFFLRALCFLTKTPPSLVLTRTTSPEPGKNVHQFAAVLLPGEPEKLDVTRELCKTIGVNLNGSVPASQFEAPWKPLFLEGKNNIPVESAKFVDPLWWELPAKGKTMLPDELRI